MPASASGATPFRHLRQEGARRLTAAGVPSPDHDTLQLIAAATGIDVPRLGLLADVTDDQADRFEALLRRRERREPLQHILGTVDFYGVPLEVGVGVFIPRPETELLAEYVVAHLRRTGPPAAAVVDLCAGSGAIALAVQARLPEARIVAVEADPLALEWADRNVAATGLPVMVLGGDVTDPTAAVLVELAGTADVVVSNPPYVPTGTVIDIETARWDPGAALWGGADGLDVIRRMLPQVVAIAKPGALLVLEHDVSQGESLPALLREHRHRGEPAFGDVQDHVDLAGRSRFTTAHRI